MTQGAKKRLVNRQCPAKTRSCPGNFLPCRSMATFGKLRKSLYIDCVLAWPYRVIEYSTDQNKNCNTAIYSIWNTARSLVVMFTVLLPSCVQNSIARFMPHATFSLLSNTCDTREKDEWRTIGWANSWVTYAQPKALVCGRLISFNKWFKQENVFLFDQLEYATEIEYRPKRVPLMLLPLLNQILL